MLENRTHLLLSENVVSINDFDRQSSVSTALNTRMPATSHIYSENAVAFKRRRVDRACDACRRRKTKCDGSKMPKNVCTNCVQTHKSCTYLEDSKPRGPPKAYITGLEDKVEELEALLRMLQPEIDLDTELGPPIIRDSWKTDNRPASPSNSNSSKGTSWNTGLPKPQRAQSSRSIPLGNMNPSSHSPVSLYTFLPDTPGASHSASSSLDLSIPNVPNPFNQRSHADTTHSSEPLSDSEDSDDEFGHLSITKGTRRLTLNSTDLPIDHPDASLRFLGKSSGYKFISRARKMRAGCINEISPPTSACSEVSTHGSTKSFDPTSIEICPRRRMEFWTTPPWELAWEGVHDTSPQLLPRIITVLPPLDLARQLIDLFFIHVNTYFPLLHKPTFERHWQDGLQYRDVWFCCLCLSVFAAASRWSDDVRILPHDGLGKINWREGGLKYFEAALSVHQIRLCMVTPACLYEVQAHAALSIFLRGTSDNALSWLCVSVGLRKAQDLGAHRRRVYGNKLSVDEEQWRRVFWLLVVFDRLSSAGLGRPCCIKETDFDVDLPAEVDDEYWENNDPTLAFQQPYGKPAKVTFFNSFVKLTHVISTALRTIYAINQSKLKIDVPQGSNWKEAIVMKMNTMMTEWVDTVPQHLKWSPTMQHSVFANQAATLYTTYYLTQILIYRPFIPLAPTSTHPSQTRSVPMAYDNFPFPAFTICNSAAKSCVRILGIQMKRGLSNIPNFISVAHICAAVLLANVWDLKTKDKAQQLGQLEDVKPQFLQTIDILLDDVSVFIHALELVEKRWDNAHLFLQHLKASLPSTSQADKHPDTPVNIHQSLQSPRNQNIYQPTPSFPLTTSGLSSSQTLAHPHWQTSASSSPYPSQGQHRQSHSDPSYQSRWDNHQNSHVVFNRPFSASVPSNNDGWPPQAPPQIHMLPSASPIPPINLARRISSNSARDLQTLKLQDTVESRWHLLAPDGQNEVWDGTRHLVHGLERNSSWGAGYPHEFAYSREY